MRKTSLFLMSLLMVLCFTVPIFAAETTYDLSANNDNSVYATFNDETGLLTISGSGSVGDGSDGTITLPKDDDAMIILDAVPTNFMVTVPIAINAFMDSLGNVSTGDGYYVENVCAWGPVVIKDVKVVSESDWVLVDWDSDFANMQASTKNMGMTINGVKVAVTGVVSLNDDLSSVIKYQDSKELTFELRLPAQRVALQENIAAVVFTVDFDKV